MASHPSQQAAEGMQVQQHFSNMTEHEQRKQTLLVPSRQDTTSLLVSQQQTHRVNDPSDLVRLAQYVQTADEFTRATVGGKLELISEQIRGLQEQARTILSDAKRDVELNHARCNFKRVPGRVYHLYRRCIADAGAGNGEQAHTYFSMLSPAEWGKPTEDEFLGSYRLEHDMSWTPLEEIAARDSKRMLDPALLGVDEAASAQGKRKQVMSLTFV